MDRESERERKLVNREKVRDRDSEKDRESG